MKRNANMSQPSDDGKSSILKLQNADDEMLVHFWSAFINEIG